MKTTAFVDLGPIDHPLPDVTSQAGRGGWHGYSLDMTGQDPWVDELWGKVRRYIPGGYVADVQWAQLQAGEALALQHWHFDYMVDTEKPTRQFIWTACAPQDAAPTEWAEPFEPDHWGENYWTRSLEFVPEKACKAKPGHLYEYSNSALHRGCAASRACIKVLVRWHNQGGTGHPWSRGTGGWML